MYHTRLTQDYGAAVTLDVTSRTLAIGSPLADYDKLGTDEPETYDTRPDKAGARARGKVYVYYSEPAVQVWKRRLASRNDWSCSRLTFSSPRTGSYCVRFPAWSKT